MTETRSTSDASSARTLAWAAFLASSWTWCIGMFLPVLLVRDYGIGGWVVFAVPNVIGAAAMGWVLRDADASRRFLIAHRPACVAFSAVTIAFHAFFAAWIIRAVVGAWAGVAVAVIFALVWMTVSLWDTGALFAAVVAIIVSLSAGAIGLAKGLLPHLPPPPRLPQIDLLWLAPVCLFGFALCPYLDLTFHRARQETSPAAGRAAFGIGFGVLFLAMILFTLAYSGWLAADPPFVLPALLIWILGAHLIVQSCFTVAVHGRAMIRLGRGNLRWAMVVVVFAAVAAGLGIFAPAYRYHGLAGDEIVYRCFMGCYGLVFPAYVWIAAVPARGGEVTAAQKSAVFVAIVLAAPMYWLGFVEQKMIWLLPGIAVVLAAGILPALTKAPPASPSLSPLGEK